MGDECRISRKRGRPVGHRLSERTKDKIRCKRLGTHHSKATKDKISKSLEKYFKKRDSLSESIEHDYRYFPKEATDWVCENKEAIDSTEHVITTKRFSYVNQVELNFGADIETLFGHNTTPEFLLLLKEEIAEALDKSKIVELHSLL